MTPRFSCWVGASMCGVQHEGVAHFSQCSLLLLPPISFCSPAQHVDDTLLRGIARSLPFVCTLPDLMALVKGQDRGSARMRACHTPSRRAMTALSLKRKAAPPLGLASAL